MSFARVHSSDTNAAHSTHTHRHTRSSLHESITSDGYSHSPLRQPAFLSQPLPQRLLQQQRAPSLQGATPKAFTSSSTSTTQHHKHTDLQQQPPFFPPAAAAGEATPSFSLRPPPPPPAAAAAIHPALTANDKPFASSFPSASSVSLSTSTGGRKRKSSLGGVAEEEGGEARLAPGSAAEGEGARFWTPEEDRKLTMAVMAEGPRNWKRIALEHFPGTFNDTQCLNRWLKVLRPGLVKGPWTEEEDALIAQCMQAGLTKWADIAERIPGRLGKQCRERWLNHLDPNVKKGAWTHEEDAILLESQAKHGNAWATIAEKLPGRSENAVKNRWNSAKHARTRRASLPPPRPVYQWDEALEVAAVQEYCRQVLNRHAASLAGGLMMTMPSAAAAAAAAPAGEWTTSPPPPPFSQVVTEFIPSVVGKLQNVKPSVYGLALNSTLTKSLLARLRAFLDKEAYDQGPQSFLYHAVLQQPKKKRKASAKKGPKKASTRPPQEVVLAVSPAAAAAAITFPVSATFIAPVPTQTTMPPPAAAAAAAAGGFVEQQQYAAATETHHKRTRTEEEAAEREAPMEVCVAGPFRPPQQPALSLHLGSFIREPRPSHQPEHHHDHHHSRTHDEEDSISSISAMSSEASVGDTEDERDEASPKKHTPAFPAQLHAVVSPPTAAAALPASSSSSSLSLSLSSSSCSVADAPSSLSVDEHCGLRSLALAVSSLCSPMSGDANTDRCDSTCKTVLPSKISSSTQQLQQQQQQEVRAVAPKRAATVTAPVMVPSQRMRDVISLLFSAMRQETDFARRGLLQDALDAATQDAPAMVNLVEGVLGCNTSGFSLAKEDDRLFLLDQLMTATHRGVFGPRSHQW